MPEKQTIIEIPFFSNIIWKIVILKVTLVFGLILVPTWLKFELKNQVKIVLEASWRPDWASWRPDWASWRLDWASWRPEWASWRPN